ncbi:hypothetical protein OTU49_009247, partial [Cherax quadricarinatus]
YSPHHIMLLPFLLMLLLSTFGFTRGGVPPANDCFADNFQCANGICIPMDRVCDGVLNCVTGTDEDNCNFESKMGDCAVGYYQCDDGICIPDDYVCDGVLNCVTGIDEANCS